MVSGYMFSPIKFSTSSLRGFYQTKCSMCSSKALYHCSGSGYCREHRTFATDRLNARAREVKARHYEALKKASDNRALSRESARKMAINQ